MSTQTTEAAPLAPAPAVAPVASPASSPLGAALAAGGVELLEGLQRTAGNRAVCRMLARQSLDERVRGDDARNARLRESLLALAQGAIRRTYGRLVPADAPEMQPGYVSSVHRVSASTFAAVDTMHANDRGIDSAEHDRSRRRDGSPHGLTIPPSEQVGAGTRRYSRAGVYLREDESRDPAQVVRNETQTLVHELLHTLGDIDMQRARNLTEGVTQYLALGATNGRVDEATIAAAGTWAAQARRVLALKRAVPGLTNAAIATAFFTRSAEYLRQVVDDYLGDRSFVGIVQLLEANALPELIDAQLAELLSGRQRIGTLFGGVQSNVDHAAEPGTEAQRAVVAHPERASWTDWIHAFRFLERFGPDDRVPTRGGGDRSGPANPAMDVIGERAPRRERPSESPHEATPRVAEVPGDRLVDHPTLGSLQGRLPEHLIRTAYRLPTDCADVAIILRHVWLAANGQHETVTVNGRALRIGTLPAGGEEGYLQHDVLPAFASHNAAAMIRTPYPQLTVAALSARLSPGDLLVWRHPDGGGHVQTVMHVERSAQGRITRVHTLAGNQPLPSSTGERYRWTPGRRIEIQYIEEPDIRDRGGVWTWHEGTRLAAAGPSGGARP